MGIFKNQSDGSSNLGKEIISKRAAIGPFYWYTKIANIFLFEAKVVNIYHTLLPNLRWLMWASNYLPTLISIYSV